jgi:cell division protein FtsZ
METYINQNQENKPSQDSQNTQQNTYSQPSTPQSSPQPASTPSTPSPAPAPRPPVTPSPSTNNVKGPGFSTEAISHKAANKDIDDELESLISSNQTRIKVIGCGGGGNNTINRIADVGVKGIQTIAINTDAQDLLYTGSDKKLLIGKELTKGLGAGSNPKIGEEAARESEHELKKLMEGSDMIFITCGLGGGTGTGSAPYIAQVAKKLGILAVGIVTMPFSMEGNHRFENAIIGLEKLEQSINTLIVIPNEKLLELAPHLPLHTAFKVSDEILTNAVKGIAELVTKTGLVNLDFADVKAIMSEGGVAMIGVGESDSEDRANESVNKALENPLIDVDIANASGALINISGGDSLTLEESRKIVETVAEKLSDRAKIIWGAQIYKDLEKTIKTLVIVTGVTSEQIFGTENTYFGKKKEAMESELGIEYLD